MIRLERLAPAKVNLFLHVGPPGRDGYHPIASLVTFADVGDIVRLGSAAETSFLIGGPFAEGLDNGPDNLVVRARDALRAEAPLTAGPLRLTLDKRLPIAAGVGGGSADAAATLRLLAEALDFRDEDALIRIAASLGADGPMCLAGRPALAEGRGDRLSAPPAFPPLPAVLVNPRTPSPTGAVYRAFDDVGAPGRADAPALPALFDTVAGMAAFLRACRNDLEAPAMRLQPAIAEALAALRARPETLLARMSGSGATCFALCAGAAERDRLARAMSHDHPGWWVQPCMLMGQPTSP
jgi:4-diphosphocytidyl-2-C-methyl-D-erythritol kinase